MSAAMGGEAVWCSEQLVGLKHAQIKGFVNLAVWRRNADLPHHRAETGGETILHVVNRPPHVRHVNAAGIVKVDGMRQPTIHRLSIAIDPLSQSLIHAFRESLSGEGRNNLQSIHPSVSRELQSASSHGRSPCPMTGNMHRLLRILCHVSLLVS